MKARVVILALAFMGAFLTATPEQAGAARRDSGRLTCSTAKGVLRATHSWTPNGTQTFHQVFTTEKAKVKGKSALKYTYQLYSVKNSANAPVSYMRGARVFSTKRGVVPKVTITWRAKVPATIGGRYLYASCTTKP